MSRNELPGDGEKIEEEERQSNTGERCASTQESTSRGYLNTEPSSGLQQEDTRVEDQTTDLEVLAASTTGPVYSAFSPWKKRYMCVFLSSFWSQNSLNSRVVTILDSCCR